MARHKSRPYPSSNPHTGRSDSKHELPRGIPAFHTDAHQPLQFVAPAPLSEANTKEQDHVDSRQKSAPLTTGGPVLKEKKKPAKRAKPDWVWTSEMEVDLLQFVMGDGCDVHDHYENIKTFFKEEYGVEVDDGQLQQRFTILRGVQKAVLTKYGRPLPKPIKYKKKNKAVDVPQEKEELPQEKERPSGSSRGQKRGAGEMELEPERDVPRLTHQNDSSVVISMEQFMAEARELQKQMGVRKVLPSRDPEEQDDPSPVAFEGVKKRRVLRGIE